MYKVLSIAGSDSSGGAGIQADLKTFQEYKVYGMTALTAVATMNPEDNWSHTVYPLSLEALQSQLKTIIQGIGVDALKTGMLGSKEIINLVAQTIQENHLKNVVIDPVMVCKGAEEALYPEVNQLLRDKLVPLALIVTPNLFEAAQLSGLNEVKTLEDMKKAAVLIKEKGCGFVLIKGGSRLEEEKYAVDLLYDGQQFTYLEGEKIVTSHTHGAGCTYSAAITAGLAQGKELKEAVQQAKQFVTAAIKAGFPLNQFIGPVNHAAFYQQ
ncbi:MAG: pyridoxine/pyridoxal/pyridoxamine kinase [Clostridia bacterium]|nr:pyridoxine/pyridoxal/pyridoxamine kinase [Clostridia bacterium]